MPYRALLAALGLLLAGSLFSFWDEGGRPAIDFEPQTPEAQAFAEKAREPTVSGRQAMPAIDVAGDTEPAAVARTGIIIRGLVSNSLGQPVPHAEVCFRPAAMDGPQATERPRPTTTSVTCDGMGRFEMDVAPYKIGRLQARADGVGMAIRHDVELEPLDSPLELKLILVGTGGLAGRVMDPSGEPLRRYSLWAIPGSHGSATSGKFSAALRMADGGEAGLFDSKTVTDEQGFFRFEGLKRSVYHIRGTLDGSRGFGALLTTEPVAVGSEGLLLTVRRHRIILSLRAVSGENLPFKAADTDWAGLSELGCYLAEVDRDGLLMDPDWPNFYGPRAELADLSQVIEVQAGRRYLLGAYSRNYALREQVVSIEFGQFTTRVELQMGQWEHPGTLEIEALDSFGQRIPTETAVVIRSPLGMTLAESNPSDLFTRKKAGDPALHSLVLPPDAYTGTLFVSEFFGEDRREHGLVSAEFGARAFSLATERVGVQLEQGGEVGLEVLLESPVSPAQVSEGSDWGLGGRLRQRLGGIWVGFEAVRGGRMHRSRFLSRQIVTRGGGSVDLTWIGAGERVKTLDPLPVGRYRVHLRREGYQAKVVPIEVLAGEVVWVREQLERVR